MELKDYLDKNHITYEVDADNLTVGSYLNLRGTGITSLPDNLTVGGHLNLRGTGITSLPDNLTVGEWLDLRGTGITSLPDNLTVGGSAYYNNTEKHIGAKVNKPVIQLPEVYTWQDGRYIKADGIFMEVVSNKGNVYHVRKLNKQEISYLVTDGHGKWSHGKTLEEAKSDLIYKIGNRDKSKYTNLTLESELTFEESIEAYRVITGACSFGTRNFVEGRLSQRQDRYTIAEIISLTAGEYGHKTFADLFNK